MKTFYCFLILTLNLFAIDYPQCYLPYNSSDKLYAPVFISNVPVPYFDMGHYKDDSGIFKGIETETANGFVSLDWESHFGSYNSPSIDDVLAMTVDSERNIYVTGRSFHLGGSVDITIIKYNTAGQQLWVTYYDGPASDGDKPNDIRVDQLGNVYVVGQCRDEYGYYQGVIIKYNSQGVFQWQRRKRYQSGKDFRNAIYAIDIDSNNDIYITGSIVTNEGYDVLITKIDPDGRELWRNVTDREEFDYGKKILVSESGNVYVAAQAEKSFWEKKVVLMKINDNGELIWKKVYSSRSSDEDVIYDFKLDKQENIYFCGTTSRLLGYHDTILAKYDSEGNELWNQYYNGTADSYDYANAMAVDDSGNVYLACNALNENTNYDFTLIKYSESGIQDWIQTLNGNANSSDIAHDLYIDSNHNITVLGQLRNTDFTEECILMSFSPTGERTWMHLAKTIDQSDLSHLFLEPDSDGNAVVSGKFRNTGQDFDMFVQQLSESGTVNWEQTFNGDYYSDNVPVDMSLSPDGGVVVAGNVMGELSSRDIAIVKYNSDGSMAWKYMYNGLENLQDSPSDLVTDKYGNSYVTGYKTSQTTKKDFITLKLNPDGVLQWENSFGQKENRDNEATCLAIDSTENVIVTGYVSTEDDTTRIYTIKYDSDGNRVWNKRFLYNEPLLKMIPNNLLVDRDNNIYISAFAGEYSYPNSAFILKYDPDGNVLWHKRIRYPGSYETWLTGMTLDDSSNIYLTGFVYLPDGTNSNIITVKFDKQGNELWSRFYNGPDNHHDQGRFVNYDGMGNIYVTGYTVENENSNIITIKYNIDGKPLWKAKYNGSLDSNEFPHHVTFDKKGNYYVLAYSYNYSADYVTIKYDQMGNDLWTMRYNSYGTFGDMPNKIVLDDYDNFYLFGSSYTDQGTVFTTLKYSQTPTAIEESGSALPAEFRLYQNYPNPFNNRTTIEYTIKEKCDVSLKIYNVKGQQVAELVSGEKMPGMFQSIWNADGFSSGMYFFRLQAGNFEQIQKLVLIK